MLIVREEVCVVSEERGRLSELREAVIVAVAVAVAVVAAVLVLIVRVVSVVTEERGWLSELREAVIAVVVAVVVLVVLARLGWWVAMCCLCERRADRYVMVTLGAVLL